MWDKMFSVESLQLAAILSFIQFSKDRAPEVFSKDSAETLPEDVAVLTELLPISDVVQIVKDFAVDEKTVGEGDETATVLAIEMSGPADMEGCMREIIAKLVTRIISNIFAYGAKEDMLDVSFDTDADSFAFALTEKGKQMQDAYIANLNARDARDATDGD